jgi:hypothetical protein
MAKISNVYPGPQLVSQRLIIKELANGDVVKFEFDQPANSTVNGVFVRTLTDLTVASAVDIGLNLGTNSNYQGTDVANDTDGILDGSDDLTSVANQVFSFTVGTNSKETTSGITNGNADITNDQRALYGEITVGAADVTPVANAIEVSIVYRIYE